MKNKEVLILRCLVGLLLLWLVLSFLKCNSQRNFDSSTLTKNETENIEIQHAKDLLQSKYDNVLNRVKKDSIKAVTNRNQLEKMKKQAFLNQAKIKLFDSGEIALFFKERYERYYEVKTTANGTEISDTIGIKTISDLVAGDDAINQLRFTNEILKDCKLTSKRKDTLIDNSKVQLELTEKQYNNCLSDNSKLKENNSKEIKFRLLAGGGFGINKDLSQIKYDIGGGWQNRKGNVFIADYSKINGIDFYTAKTYISLFTIKGKKK